MFRRHFEEFWSCLFSWKSEKLKRSLWKRWPQDSTRCSLAVPFPLISNIVSPKAYWPVSIRTVSSFVLCPHIGGNFLEDHSPCTCWASRHPAALKGSVSAMKCRAGLWNSGRSSTAIACRVFFSKSAVNREFGHVVLLEICQHSRLF